MGFGISYLRPFAFEQITVGAGSTALTSAVYLDRSTEAAKAQKAMEATITVETNGIRYRVDGGTPTSTVGHLLPSGSAITLVGTTAIANFRAYAPTPSAVLSVTYYNG